MPTSKEKLAMLDRMQNKLDDISKRYGLDTDVKPKTSKPKAPKAKKAKKKRTLRRVRKTRKGTTLPSGFHSQSKAGQEALLKEIRSAE